MCQALTKVVAVPRSNSDTETLKTVFASSTKSGPVLIGKNQALKTVDMVRNLGITKEGGSVWRSGDDTANQELTYTNWASGQPDNRLIAFFWNVKIESSNDCANMNHNDGEWYTQRCDTASHFICREALSGGTSSGECALFSGSCSIQSGFSISISSSCRAERYSAIPDNFNGVYLSSHGLEINNESLLIAHKLSHNSFQILMKPKSTCSWSCNNHSFFGFELPVWLDWNLELCFRPVRNGRNGHGFNGNYCLDLWTSLHRSRWHNCVLHLTSTQSRLFHVVSSSDFSLCEKSFIRHPDNLELKKFSGVNLDNSVDTEATEEIITFTQTAAEIVTALSIELQEGFLYFDSCFKFIIWNS